MKHIVKRAGHTEAYDQRKLYASIYSSCLAVRTPSGEAELVAEKVCKDVEQWMDQKHEVTAHDIRRVAHQYLEAYNPDAAYIYKMHREILRR